MATKFPLGFYGGNPDGSDPVANATFESQYDSFVTLMGGARPAFMNAFVDDTQDPGSWAANAGWTAWSWAQTGSAYVGPGSGVTPVIGVPMASNSGGWSNADSFYQAIISGAEDADYRGIVDAWADQGYKTIDLRLGYEFDGNFMPWSPGNSASPTVDADFVAAWQHLADLVHAEGQADGITVDTVWNPDDLQWSAAPVTSLYPGNAYVDIIGTDSYSPVDPPQLVNWQSANGTGTDYSLAPDATTWAASATNREHDWTYSNLNEWNPTGQAGAGWSIQQAVEMAEITGKPLGIGETGAGGNGSTTGPVDDAAFPTWLAAELSQPGAPQIAFVDIWATDQSDGDWGFLDGEKPAEAAAWAANFGTDSSDVANGPAVAAAPLSVDPNDVATFLGAGDDSLTLEMSEDAYEGDAQFTVSVDGGQVGGVQTATALHGAGQDQSFVLQGNWGPGEHTVAVQFLNDAWGGTPDTDRNLYVDGESYDGIAANQPLALMSSGTMTATVGVPSPSTASFTDDQGASLTQPVIGSGSETTYAGVLDGNVHQWVDGGTTWLSTDSFGVQVTDADVTDGVGGSYGLADFEEADAGLSGAANGTLTIQDAAGGNLRLGSGNYDATIQAKGNGGDTAARNTFNISLGSGADDVSMDASGGWGLTSAVVTAGPGTDKMSFIWPGAVTVYGGSGQAAVTVVGGTNQFFAGGGALDVDAVSGANAYHFVRGDGLLTVADFSASQGDTLWFDSSLQSIMSATSDGHGGLMISFNVSTVGVDLLGVTALDPSTIHWT